jgi:hypothetical protein
MTRPGEWALLDEPRWWHEQAASCAARDLRSRIRYMPPGRWEFRSGRINGSDQWGIWARWLGNDEEDG